MPTNRKSNPIGYIVGVLIALIVAWILLRWVINTAWFFIKFAFIIAVIGGVVSMIFKSKSAPKRK